ncbi:hypothetical protein ACT7DJ_12915 [Bacillus cereus]
MVKYRLGYDYVFIPNEPIAYKGEDVSSMSVYVLFQVLDENGQERLFESEELDRPTSFSKKWGILLFNKCSEVLV